MGGTSEAGARSRPRDVLVLVALAAFLVTGIVHYGRGLGEEDASRSARETEAPSPSGSPEASPGASPSASPGASAVPTTPASTPTAQLEGGTPTTPGTPPSPHGGTCWDGRETSALTLCGLPEGARGLEWVFPSFARDRAQCHPAEPNTDSYPVAVSFECFQRALGRAVTVTYDQVQDPAQVEQWLLARVGAANRTTVPGAHGGRHVYWDRAARPVRITGTYARFPYAVSVYAATPDVALRAWRTIVDQRPPQAVRGVRG